MTKETALFKTSYKQQILVPQGSREKRSQNAQSRYKPSRNTGEEALQNFVVF
jgi:hypothetical protein